MIGSCDCEIPNSCPLCAIPDPKPMFWIKTPKTGGTSLQFYLKDHSLLHWPSFENNWLVQAGKVSMVLPEHPQDAKFGKYIWPKAITFAVVRNPYDKLVSAWKFFDEYKDIPLERFVKNLPTCNQDWDKWMHTTQTTVDFLNQYGNLKPDQILKYENLEPEINELFVEHGYEPIKLKHFNTSVRKRDWRFYMTPEIEEAIYKHFEIDFVTFGYERYKLPG